MIGYKLFRKRKDGTYGPLFINRRERLKPGIEYTAFCYPTKGYAVRPGWHICRTPSAPHLSTKDRVWCKVEFTKATELQRPESQGGVWYLAQSMRILHELPAIESLRFRT